RREALVTTVVGAVPEYVHRLAHPTWIPLLAAFATAPIFVGTLVSRYSWSLAGIALLTLVALVWLWERAPAKLEKDVGHGLRLPLTLGDTRSAGWLGAVMFLLVDAALFVSLIYAFFYLWTSSSLWPPIGYASDAGAPVLAAAALLSMLVPAAVSAHIGTVRGRPALALSGLAAM